MGGIKALRVDPSNADQARAWDGNEGELWAKYAERYDRSLAGYDPQFLDAARIAATDRVLDIGCGTGQTTRNAARLAPAGSALGVDVSSPMLDVARVLARAEGLSNASFEQADAQIHPFEERAYDAAISRTGAMFFGDLTAAFTNIARALRPGGRLVLLTWQPVSHQDWFLSFTTAMSSGRPLPSPPPEAPSPFSLSDPLRVRQLLTSVGFSEPHFEGLRAPMPFGSDPDDAYAFVLETLGWMLNGLDGAARDAALDELHATMVAHHGAQGVAFDSATWLITAERL